MTRTPSEAVSLYLDGRRTEVAESTIQSHRYRLNHFVSWCGEQDIDQMDELDPTDLHEYRIWRRSDGDLSPASEKTQMDTLRVFVRFCEQMQMVEKNLSDAVQSPTLSSSESSRSVIVPTVRAGEIIEWLDKFQYASVKHVIFSVLHETGMRTCSLHSLDVDDFHADDRLLEVRHRPDTDTQLKNADASERFINLSDTTTEIIRDWLDNNRPDVADDYGREPLIASSHGRLHRSTVRKYSYQVTCRCDCGVGPSDEGVACDGEDSPYGCPGAKSPHAWRRGAITHLLSEDVPPEIVSDRCDVSTDVIEQHYDGRSERERVDQRRRFLSNV